MIYLGFDTSNYTTSCAVCGDLSQNISKLLNVKTGERGLRQSDALFQHIKALPFLYEELCSKCNIKDVMAVGVSTRPRSVEGSYMPVFLAGEGYARVCAATLKVPLYEFSHQDGHIMSAIHSCDNYSLLEKPFISVHLSGGTSEILLTQYNKKGFDCKIIGGTKDISAGQLIDRVGVKMGMNFPCGKQLEKLAFSYKNPIKLPVNSCDGYINFSGIETKALTLCNTQNHQDLAYSLFDAIASALIKALSWCRNKTQIDDILIAGGVASNSIIKKRLLSELGNNVYFASPELACDNAYGIALLTKFISCGDKI